MACLILGGARIAVVHAIAQRVVVEDGQFARRGRDRLGLANADVPRRIEAGNRDFAVSEEQADPRPSRLASEFGYHYSLTHIPARSL